MYVPIPRRIEKTIETLVSEGYEAAKGQGTETGIPTEIIVGGETQEEIKNGFHNAVQRNGLSDYISSGGKEYTR